MLRIVLFLVVLVLYSGLLPAASRADQAYADWLRQLRQEAAEAGISKATIDEALASPQLLEVVVKADRNQPEFKKDFSAYLQGVLSKKRIAEGRKRLHQHQPLLNRIAREYGVQPRFIVALWGIETFYGKYTGTMPIIDSLVTLAYDQRRGPYFRSELLKALRIIDAGHVSYQEMKGSWAGAMGQLQFMPSSFIGYAVDGDKDGVIDLWQTREDYLSSAANYLAEKGWRNDQTWGREVKLPDGLDAELITQRKTALLDVWHKYGVRNLDGTRLPGVKIRASLIRPGGEGGRAFLVYDNYQVLMKWNRAHSFALSVGMLADRLRK